MPGPQREPGWVRAPGRSYSKGIGSIASSLPLAGPDEWSILGILELTSVWAETAHFQLPTPREYWRGHISGSERSWDLPLREHREPLLVGLGVPWFPATRLWLGGTPPPLAGFQGPDRAGHGLCLSPRPHQPLRGSDLRLGYELGLSVYCPVMPLPQSSLNPMCTYPDVLLYILLFPLCRVARILKRFVT